MAQQCGRSEVLPQLRTTDPCNIASEVKKRNGDPNQWCNTHGQEVPIKTGVGPGGSCDASGTPPVPDDEILDLELADYPGGVAAWGATAPVIAIGNVNCTERGVHVHARTLPGGDKVIDGSYTIVNVFSEGAHVALDAETARAHVATTLAGFPNTVLHCRHCDFIHVDRDVFAIRPHRKHLCNRCGRMFWNPNLTISNPVAAITTLPGVTAPPAPVGATDTMTINAADYSGVAIWPSNPAILWTSDTPEAEGIHVHAWDRGGNLVVDETYGAVTLDGVNLDLRLLRQLMVQRIVVEPTRIGVARCPDCDTVHAESDVTAYEPSGHKHCTRCERNYFTPGRRLMVSNPILEHFPTLDNQKGGEHGHS